LHLAWLFYLRLPYKKLRSQIPWKEEPAKICLRISSALTPDSGQNNKFNQIAVKIR
jgi:hypothetical protein